MKVIINPINILNSFIERLQILRMIKFANRTDYLLLVGEPFVTPLMPFQSIHFVAKLSMLTGYWGLVSKADDVMLKFISIGIIGIGISSTIYYLALATYDLFYFIINDDFLSIRRL